MKKYSAEINKLFPDSVKEAIVKKIEEAESQCACEFKLVVARQSMPGYMFKALQILSKANRAKIYDRNVKMHARFLLGKFVAGKTHLQNVVILLISYQERKAYMMVEKSLRKIITQEKIQQCLPLLAEGLANNNVLDGVTRTLDVLCQELKQHFPPQANQSNQLSNNIEIV